MALRYVVFVTPVSCPFSPEIDVLFIFCIIVEEVGEAQGERGPWTKVLQLLFIDSGFLAKDYFTRDWRFWGFHCSHCRIHYFVQHIVPSGTYVLELWVPFFFFWLTLLFGALVSKVLTLYMICSHPVGSSSNTVSDEENENETNTSTPMGEFFLTYPSVLQSLYHLLYVFMMPLEAANNIYIYNANLSLSLHLQYL